MGMRLPSVMPSTDIRVLLTMPLSFVCETHRSSVSTPWVALLFVRTHWTCFPTCCCSKCKKRGADFPLYIKVRPVPLFFFWSLFIQTRRIHIGRYHSITNLTRVVAVAFAFSFDVRTSVYVPSGSVKSMAVPGFTSLPSA